MNITKQLIEAYLKGECTEAEIAAIEKYLASNPDKIDKLLPKNEWESIPDDSSYDTEAEVYQKILSQTRNRPLYLRYIGAVASIAAILLLIFGINRYLENDHEADIVIKSPIPSTTLEKQVPQVPNLYYINSGNSDMRLVSSDGSIITLSPKSEIRYAEDFTNLHERILRLKGRAKFEVAKDKTKPFRVISQGIVTTALGTVFIVDEFKASETHVKLLEGSIEVLSQAATHKSSITRTFKPMEEITINHIKGKIIQEKKINAAGIEREGYFANKNKTILFQNLALRDVVSVLQQNYGIILQYTDDSLTDKYYSGSFRDGPEVYKDIIAEINYLHNTTITYTVK